MKEITCRNCKRKVNGQADLCLFCGKKLPGGRGGLTGGRRRGFPVGIFLTIMLLSCLFCVLFAQLEPVRRAAAALLPSQPEEPLVIPTDVPAPTPAVVARKAPSSPPSVPDETPVPTDTPSSDVLMPESGGRASEPFVVLALGGMLLILGLVWRARFEQGQTIRRRSGCRKHR
jgi:hypothetical protein